jgi:hypothetical protein
LRHALPAAHRIFLSRSIDLGLAGFSTWKATLQVVTLVMGSYIAEERQITHVKLLRAPIVESTATGSTTESH